MINRIPKVTFGIFLYKWLDGFRESSRETIYFLIGSPRFDNKSSIKLIFD